ncbi:MAG: hypothetical protein HY240_08960 [Actinobacteria bacterium]|nr:hypothetical protein [Actinomycetota bacterium]
MSTPEHPSEDPRGARSRPRPVVLVVTVAVVASVMGAAIGIDFAGRSGHMGVAPSATGHAMAPPLDLSTVSPEVASHYRFAAAHPGVYAQVPCYCGCDDSLGHRNLLDCFVRSDGKGWDAHASGCGVCMGESEMVRPLVAKGRSPTQIRDAVIAEYGPPTSATTQPSAQET